MDEQAQVNANEQEQTPVITEVPGVEVEDPQAVLLAEINRLMLAKDYEGAMKKHAEMGKFLKEQRTQYRDAVANKWAAFQKDIEDNANENAKEYEKSRAEVESAGTKGAPAFVITIRVGFQGEDAKMNGAKFTWASGSAKPTKGTRTFLNNHAREGTLSKDGVVIGEYPTAKEAAQKNGVVLKLVGAKQTPAPATTALKKAGFTWTPKDKATTN